MVCDGPNPLGSQYDLLASVSGGSGQDIWTVTALLLKDELAFEFWTLSWAAT